MNFFTGIFAILTLVSSLSFAKEQFKTNHALPKARFSSSYKLSLQGILSNFTDPADPMGGNNGLPITDMSIPTIIKVKPSLKKNKVTLSIKPFSFTLTATGFMISENVLPHCFAPTQAKWIDFDAGSGVVGHVFRDGSIRYTGIDNQPLPAGAYDIHATQVSYSVALFPDQAKDFFYFNKRLVKGLNFPISEGQTNQGGLPLTVNSGFDYGEYYGMVFRDGMIYTSTTDNSFNNTTTPIIVFNKLNKKGHHLISQVNVVSPGFANGINPGTGYPQLGEETLSINPANPKQLATTCYTYHDPEPTLPVSFLFVTNDGGSTWNAVDVFANLGPLPTLPGFSEPLVASDQVCIYDSFGNLFYAPLCVILNFSDFSVTLVEYVLVSPDNGVTWELVDFISGINPKTYGLDYPIIATGAGPDHSSVTWLMLKQDINFQEIEENGSTLPLMAAAYQTTGKGIVASKAYFELPGTEVGGYGNISVGPKGEVLVVGEATNNTLGTLPSTNSSLFYSFNPGGINGGFKSIKILANSNTGYSVAYLPQFNRDTWSHPNAVIDQKGRWYFLYVDQPTPHLKMPNPNIYLIYSDNRGKSWSTPVRINNDVDNHTFHFMPQMSVDPLTNDLAITWLDTREDETDTLTRLWGTVIKNGSLPRLK